MAAGGARVNKTGWLDDMKEKNEKWLDWAIELQSLAQAGLTYGGCV